MAKHRLILLAIIVAGFFLRTYRLTEGIWWVGDQARDAATARHMVVYREGIAATPVATGGGGILGNTPLYYWLVALAWSTTESIAGILLLFIFVGLLTIVFGYLVGKEVGGRRCGLLMATFVAFHWTLVETSRQFWQPHLVPFFTLSSVYLVMKSLKYDGRRYFFSAFAYSLVAASIHLSLLPLFGVSLFVLIRKVIYRYRRPDRKSIILGLLYSAFLISALSFIVLNHGVRESQAVMFSSTGSFFERIIVMLSLISGSVFGIQSGLAGLLMLVVMSYLIWKMKRFRGYIFLIFLSSLFLVVSGIEPKRQYVFPWVVMSLLVLSTIRVSLKGFRGLAVGFFLVPFFFSGSWGYLKKQTNSEYHIWKKVTEKIVQDYLMRPASREGGLLIRDNIIHRSVSKLRAAHYYYFVEQMLSKRFLFITDPVHNVFLVENEGKEQCLNYAVLGKESDTVPDSNAEEEIMKFTDKSGQLYRVLYLASRKDCENP